jgi:hypothetical protein
MSLVLSAIRGSSFSKAKKQTAVGGVRKESIWTLRATACWTRPTRPLVAGATAQPSDITDPPCLRDEAMVTLHELLNLGGRGHFMPFLIVRPCCDLFGGATTTEYLWAGGKSGFELGQHRRLRSRNLRTNAEQTAGCGTQDAAAAPSSGSITRFPEEVWNSLIASESRWRYFGSAR